MKVLYVINSLFMGGAEKLLVDTLPKFKSKGVSVELLLLDGTSTPLLKMLEEADIKVHKLGFYLYNPFLVFKIIPFLKRYDVVHVHLFPSQYYVAVAQFLSMAKCKLIFTEHSTGNKRIGMRWLRPLEKWIYSKYKKIICITPQVKDVLINKLSIAEKKLSVIYNGIDLELIEKAVASKRDEFGLTEHDRVVVMVAAFRSEKDHKTVIKCVPNLPSSYKILFVGGGELQNELITFAESIEVQDRIIFTGVRTDVYSIIKMSDVSLLSSHWEGFGLSAVEAMACGVPLVASNVPGLAQVVGDGGLLFENYDIQNLVSCILSLENTDLKAMNITKGFKRALDFDCNLMVDNLINAYKS